MEQDNHSFSGLWGATAWSMRTHGGRLAEHWLPVSRYPRALQCGSIMSSPHNPPRN